MLGNISYSLPDGGHQTGATPTFHGDRSAGENFASVLSKLENALGKSADASDITVAGLKKQHERVVNASVDTDPSVVTPPLDAIGSQTDDRDTALDAQDRSQDGRNALPSAPEGPVTDAEAEAEFFSSPRERHDVAIVPLLQPRRMVNAGVTPDETSPQSTTMTSPPPPETSRSHRLATQQDTVIKTENLTAKMSSVQGPDSQGRALSPDAVVGSGHRTVERVGRDTGLSGQPGPEWVATGRSAAAAGALSSDARQIGRAINLADSAGMAPQTPPAVRGSADLPNRSATPQVPIPHDKSAVDMGFAKAATKDLAQVIDRDQVAAELSDRAAISEVRKNADHGVTTKDALAIQSLRNARATGLSGKVVVDASTIGNRPDFVRTGSSLSTTVEAPQVSASQSRKLADHPVAAPVMERSELPKRLETVTPPAANTFGKSPQSKGYADFDHIPQLPSDRRDALDKIRVVEDRAASTNREAAYRWGTQTVHFGQAAAAPVPIADYSEHLGRPLASRDRLDAALSRVEAEPEIFAAAQGEPRFATGGSTVAGQNLPATNHQSIQMIRQMMEVSGQLRDGPVEVSLRPEELGRVRMQILSNEQGVLMNITAERSETLDMLRRHIDQLHRDLTAMGYDNPRFSFGHEGGQHQGQSQSGGTSRNLGIPELPEHPTPVDLRLQTDGLDIRI